VEPSGYHVSLARVDRVFGDAENDGKACGRSLCCECRRSAHGNDHGHLAAQQFTGHGRQPIVLALCKAILDPQVAPLNIACLREALSECRSVGGSCCLQERAKKSVVLERIDSAVRDVSIPYSDDQGVSIGRRAGDPAGTYAACRTTDILNNYGLAKRRPHAIGQDAPDHVRQPARGEWHDHGDRTRRIGLRLRDPRHGWQCGSTRCQMQKSTTGKFHDGPSLDISRAQTTRDVNTGRSRI
jgi:hypothetical protein